MASKQIVFEIVIDSSPVDKAAEGTKTKIVSLSSTLNESLAKLENLQKVMSSVGNNFPAIGLLRELNAELKKSEAGINRIKDAELKSLIAERVEQIKQTSLPGVLKDILPSTRRAMTSGNLDKALIDKLEKAYAEKNIQPPAHQITLADYQAWQQSVAAAKTEPTNLVKESANILSQQLKLKNAELKANIGAINSVISAFYAEQAKFLPVNVLQTGKERVAAYYEHTYGRTDLLGVARGSADNALTSREATDQLINKYRPVSFEDKLKLEQDALVTRLLSLPSESEEWAKTAKVLEQAEKNLKQYIQTKYFLQTEDSLRKNASTYTQQTEQLSLPQDEMSQLERKLQAIILKKQEIAKQDLPDKQIESLLTDAKAAEQALQRLIALKKQQSSNLEANASVENSYQSALNSFQQNKALAAARKLHGVGSPQEINLEKSYQLSSLQKKLSDISRKAFEGLNERSSNEDRRAAETLLAKAIQSFSSQVNSIEKNAEAKLETFAKNQVYKNRSNQIGGILESLSEEYARLNSSPKSLDDLELRFKKLRQLKKDIAAENLTDVQTNKLLLDLGKIEVALKNIMALRVQQANAIKANEGIASSHKSAFSSLEDAHRMETTKSRFGADSVQVINLREQQQLASLREDYQKQTQAQLSTLDQYSSNEKRRQVKQQLDSITDAYKRQSSAVIQNAAAMRSGSLAIQAKTAATQNLLVRLSELVIGYRAISFVLNSVTTGISNIPTAGIKLENVNATLTAMYVVMKDVAEQFHFLDVVADRTGGRLASLRGEFADFSASAVAAGESTKHIQQTFADLMDVATVLHLPEEKVHSAFVAISQMYAKNQVMAEELKRQLGNALPGAVSLFARSQGMNTAELLKAMKDGKVLPKDTVSSFLSFYKQIMAPEDAFSKASQGLYANIGRMQNEYTRTSEALYKKSSDMLIGFTQVATSGMKLLRENLDGILTILTEIGVVAAGLGTIGLFGMARTGFAKAAINSEATLIARANAKLPKGAEALKGHSLENPMDIEKFAGAGMILSNLALIAKANPVITSVTLGIAGLSAAMYALGKIKVDLGQNITLTIPEIVQTKLESLREWASNGLSQGMSAVGDAITKQEQDKLLAAYASITNNDPIKKSRVLVAGDEIGKMAADVREAYVKGELQLSTALRSIYDQRAKDRAAINRRGLASLLSDEEVAKKVAAARATEESEKQADFLENIRQKNQKLLLLEDTASNTPFDNKAFTRSIELVGRAVELELNKVSQIANNQVTALEAQLNRLDKYVARGLMSPGQAYLKKRELAGQEYQTKQAELDTREQLALIDVAANRKFSEMNDEVATAERLAKLATDKVTQMTQVGLGKATLKVNGEDKVFDNLGAWDRGLSPEQQAAKTAEINKKRREYQLALGTPSVQVENPLAKDITNGLPPLLNPEDYDKAIEKAATLNQRVIELKEELTRRVSSVGSSDFDQASGDLSLDNILAGLIHTESRFKAGAVSPKRARGYGQVMPATGGKPGFGVEPLKDNSDAENVRFSRDYLTGIMGDFSKRYPGLSAEELLRISLAGYNGGPNLMKSRMGEAENDPFKALSLMPGESQAYPNKVISAAQIPSVQKAYSDLLQSLGDLQRDIDGSMVFKDKNRSAAVAGAGTTFRGKIIGQETSRQRIQEEFNFKQRLEFFDEDFEQAKVDYWKNIHSAITIPLLERISPNTSQARDLAFSDQYKELLGRLQQEKNTPAGARFIKNNEEVDKLISEVEQLRTLANLDANNAIAQRIINAKLAMPQIELQTRQSSLDFQLSSSFEQAKIIGDNARSQYDILKGDRPNAIRRIEQTPGILPEEIRQQTASYDAQLTELENKSKSLSNFFRTELSSSMRQPLEALLTQTSSVSDALKSFGRNILGSIASNIAQELSNALSSMVIKSMASAAAASATGSASSGLIGGLFSGIGALFGLGGAGAATPVASSSVVASRSMGLFASGGEVTPKIIDKTSHISGPGTGTSDSIPAYVPFGTYILNAEVSKNLQRVNLSNGEIAIAPTDVAKIGKKKLDQLNFGTKFAKGGMVGDNVALGSKTKPSSSSNKEEKAPIYNITINQTSSGDSKQDGAQAAEAFIRAVAAKEAQKAATRAAHLHEKKRHGLYAEA